MKYEIELHIFSDKLNHIMLKKGLVNKKGEADPIKLYNLLYPNDEITEDMLKLDRRKYTDMTRYISNWIKGKNYPKSVNDILSLCNALECDLDYFFSDMECPTHDMQFIHEKTGLSEKAIKALDYIFTYKRKDVIDNINLLICDIWHKPGMEHRTRTFFDLFANYMTFSGTEQKKYALDQDGEIKEAKPSGFFEGKAYYPSNKIYFSSKQLEQMYIMEMEDIIKTLKQDKFHETQDN